jgi:aspartyl-tRNA(Asn)/glutamyl-tRNA(Gln) amidotransferase subunit C
VKLTREEVLRVAELAHLELSEAEVETYSRQLSDILTYIDKLNQLDTSAVEPMAQVMAGAVGAEEETLRADEEIPVGIAADVLKVAPDPKEPYFRVPKVIDKAE